MVDKLIEAASWVIGGSLAILYWMAMLGFWYIGIKGFWMMVS